MISSFSPTLATHHEIQASGCNSTTGEDLETRLLDSSKPDQINDASTGVSPSSSDTLITRDVNGSEEAATSSTKLVAPNVVDNSSTAFINASSQSQTETSSPTTVPSSETTELSEKSKTRKRITAPVEIVRTKRRCRKINKKNSYEKVIIGDALLTGYNCDDVKYYEATHYKRGAHRFVNCLNMASQMKNVKILIISALQSVINTEGVDICDEYISKIRKLAEKKPEVKIIVLEPLLQMVINGEESEAKLIISQFKTELQDLPNVFIEPCLKLSTHHLGSGNAYEKSRQLFFKVVDDCFKREWTLKEQQPCSERVSSSRKRHRSPSTDRRDWSTEYRSRRSSDQKRSSHQRLTSPRNITRSSDEYKDRGPDEDEWDPENEIILDIWPPENPSELSCPSSVNRPEVFQEVQDQLDIPEKDKSDLASGVLPQQPSSSSSFESNMNSSEIPIELSSANANPITKSPADNYLDMIPIVDNSDSNRPADKIIEYEFANTKSEAINLPLTNTASSSLPSRLSEEESGQGIGDNPLR